MLRCEVSNGKMYSGCIDIMVESRTRWVTDVRYFHKNILQTISVWNTACPPRWQREGIPVTSLGRVYSNWTGKLRLNKCCKFGNPRNMVWLFCRYLYMFGYIITSFFRVLPLKHRHFHTGYFAQTLIFLMRRSPIQRARGIQCLKRNSHTNYSDYPWMFKSQAHQLFV